MTSYATFVKHAEKITKSASTSRPILKGIHHAENSNVYVTDSHRLYVLENGFKTDDPFTQNPKTGEHIEGNYPDCSRLLPYDDDAVVTLNIDVKQAHEAVKILATAEKKINDGRKQSLVKFSTGTDSYCVQNGTMDGLFSGSYELSAYEGDGLPDIYVNAQYLSEALALLADSGEPNATIRLYSPVRPLTIKNSDTTALILPVRKI
mgnify:CR=1 FL=1